jgi:uncharacterized RmlC-like cupin family protein
LARWKPPPTPWDRPHHHGEAETAAYVIKGHIGVYFGEDYKEYIEGNNYDEIAKVILSRGPDNIVVNL